MALFDDSVTFASLNISHTNISAGILFPDVLNFIFPSQ